jgi:hypothetical protein
MATDLTNVATKLSHTSKTHISSDMKLQTAFLPHSLTSTVNIPTQYTKYLCNTSQLLLSVSQETSIILLAECIRDVPLKLLKSLQTHTYPSKFSFASSQTAA